MMLSGSDTQRIAAWRRRCSPGAGSGTRAASEADSAETRGMMPTFLESIFSTWSTGLGPVSCATSCSSSARSSAPRQKTLSMPP